MMMRPYWQASRAPRYSLLFALPLLIIYQILAALAPVGPGGMSVRNGADVILQSVFLRLAGAWGPRLFLLCLIGVGTWLIARDVRSHPGKLTLSVLGAMLLESVCLSLVFGVVVGTLTAALLGAPPPPMALDFSAQTLSRWTMLMLSLGAASTKSCSSAWCSSDCSHGPRTSSLACGRWSRASSRPCLERSSSRHSTISAPMAIAWRSTPSFSARSRGCSSAASICCADLA